MTTDADDNDDEQLEQEELAGADVDAVVYY